MRDAGRPLAPYEVARECGAHSSNVARALKALAAEGLLDELAAPPRPPRRRGAWPAHTYALSELGALELTQPSLARPSDERVRLTPSAAEKTAPPDAEAPPRARATSRAREGFAPGTQLVFVDASGAAHPEVLHVLADAEIIRRATGALTIDGVRQEYVIAFNGPSATTWAQELLSLLRAARIDAFRSVVSQRQSIEDFSAGLAAQAAHARRARLARDTREAS
jgi:hypothetical protein